MMTGHFIEVGSEDVVDVEMKHVTPEPSPVPSPIKAGTCGATALRLNLDLTRLYGKWHPVEASSEACHLWMTSLYGKGPEAQRIPPICVVLDIGVGPEENTLSMELSHKAQAKQMMAALLADAVHPGRSKWVISWPNGEDTLTSVVALGSVKSDSSYDWMLTIDCDIKGKVTPTWAIFGREEGLSDEAVGAIKVVLDGIVGPAAFRHSRLLQPERYGYNCSPGV